MKLGIVQASSVESALNLTDKALRQGARVVLLPKDWTVSLDLVPVSEFQKIAKLFTAHIVLGGLYDGFSVVSPIITPDGRILGLSKMIYPDVKDAVPGTELVAFKSSGNKFGVLIGNDLLHSELVLSLLKQNIDVVLVPSAVPTESLQWWFDVVKLRAAETGMVFVNANLFVPPRSGGHSLIAVPSLEEDRIVGVVKEALSDTEGFAVVDVDTTSLIGLRARKLSEIGREIKVNLLG